MAYIAQSNSQLTLFTSVPLSSLTSHSQPSHRNTMRTLSPILKSHRFKL